MEQGAGPLQDYARVHVLVLWHCGGIPTCTAQLLLARAAPLSQRLSPSQFEIWMAITVVFPLAGNVGYTLLKYRLGHRGLLSSFVKNVTYIPFL